jgi:hypothetical protein
MTIDHTIKLLVAKHIHRTHSAKTFEQIQEILDKHPAEDADDILEQNGIPDFTGDMNEAMAILLDGTFASYRIEHEDVDGFICVEVEYNERYCEVRGNNLGQIICIAALGAIGGIPPDMTTLTGHETILRSRAIADDAEEDL